MSPESPGPRKRQNELPSGIVANCVWVVNIVLDPDEFATDGLVEVVGTLRAIRALISESLVIPVLRKCQLLGHETRPNYGMWLMSVYVFPSECHH